MKNKQTNKQESMPTEYKCQICGEMHAGNSICPIMFEKVNKYRAKKNKNFWFANILLECINQNVNFLDLLFEACYYTKTVNFINDSFNMELALEYFAMELNCSPKKFIKSPEKTMEELLNIGYYLNYDSAYKDDNGNFKGVYFIFDGDWSGETESKYFDSIHEIYLVAHKEKDYTDEKWIYRIELGLPAIRIKKLLGDDISFFNFLQMSIEGAVILAEEYSGRLAEMVESSIDAYWEEMCDVVSSDDVRFDIWVNKLVNYTNLDKLSWHNREDYYSTNIDGHSIRIDLNKKERYLFNEIKSITHQFSIRLSKDKGITFILSDDDPKKEKLFALSLKIKEAIKRMENLVNEPSLQEKKIEFTDVMVVSSCMSCKTKEHKIIPYRGIVTILTEENVEEEYEIYVGYCKECGTYTVFGLDYKQMLKRGRPLCQVYKYSEVPTGRIHSDFKYKSHSVLAHRGYNVQAGSDLSEAERQSILKDCLDKELVQLHDLLDFLNWLIRTREPLPKYKNAISKWKSDIEFIEDYNIEERDSVIVKSITVKE